MLFLTDAPATPGKGHKMKTVLLVTMVSLLVAIIVADIVRASLVGITRALIGA